MGFSPEKELSKRDLFKTTLATAGALLASKLSVEEAQSSSPTEVERLMSYLRSPEADEKTFKFIEFASRFTVDDIGYRISNAWKSTKDGLWRCAWQGILLKDDPAQGIIPENTLDDFLKPYDAYLEAVYQIPPHEDFDDGSNGDLRVAFENRIKHFGISPEVTTWIKEKRTRFETGLPTSREKDYGPFKNTRLQRYVVQRLPDGTIRRVLVGDVVKELGRSIPGEKMIPDEALLPQLDLGTGVGVEINKENISIYREVLDKYVAGGEFMDASTLLGRLFVTDKGVRIIVTSNFLFNFQEAKNQPEWKGVIEIASQQDTVFIDVKSGAFIFQDSPRPENPDVYMIKDRKKILMNNSLTAYPGKIKWHPELSLVGADNLRVSHLFNKNSQMQWDTVIGLYSTEGLWNELDKYITLGTPQQLVEKSLIDFLYVDTRSTPNQTYTNLLELNPLEVEAYLQTKTDTGLKSFQILKNSKGEPSFIVQTGGRWGLKPELGNLESLRKAAERLNQIDPSIIETITKQFGVRALTGDMIGGNFTTPGTSTFGAAATYDSNLGIIKVNQDHSIDYLHIIADLISESAGVYAVRHLYFKEGKATVTGRTDFLSDKPGMHKSLYFEKWVRDNKDKLSSTEYDNLIYFALSAIDFYSKLGW